MGILRILDKKLGDKQILLNKENEEAQKEFDKATAKGYIAFEINSSGAKCLVKQLNRDAEEVIMIPHLVGG